MTVNNTYEERFRSGYLCYDYSRKYEIGDDVRYIDPFLSAKRAMLFIKKYRECRDVDLLFVLDVSRSQSCGREHSKLSAMIEYVGKIFDLANEAGDRVGFMTFSETVNEFLPVRYRKNLINISELLDKKSMTTNPIPALICLQKILKRSSVIFWMSDFHYPDKIFENVIHNMRLIAKKHDLICVQILDQIYDHMDILCRCRVEDAESMMSTFFKAGKKKYIKYLADLVNFQNTKWKEAMKKSNIPFLQTRLTDAVDKVVAKCLDKHLA